MHAASVGHAIYEDLQVTGEGIMRARGALRPPPRAPRPAAAAARPPHRGMLSHARAQVSGVALDVSNSILCILHHDR